MRKNLSLWMLGIAAMLASCSNEDVLQGTNDNDGLVRITVQLEDGMKTRAATPEETDESANVTRFVLNAYETAEDGTIQQKATDVVITDLKNGNFTAKLDRQKYYKFFCWADEDESSSYTITGNDLTSITLKQNMDGTTGYMLPTIAHRGESDVVYGETAGDVTIQLKHAVAKVILQTTGALEEGRAKLETKTCTSYNAVTNLYDNDTKETVSESGPETAVTDSDDKPAKVLQFYVLTGRTTENVVLTYTSSDDRPFTKNLNSVSFENDYRTIFVGDIAGLQWNTASITATLDENWDDDIELKLPEATADATTNTVTTKYAGQIAAMPGLLAEAVGTGNTLNIEGPMNDKDLAVLKAFLTDNAGTALLAEDANTGTGLALDLSEVTELTEIPDNALSGCTKLSSVQLSDEITRIGKSAFEGCTNLTTVNMPQNLTSMGEAAFYESGLSGEIELPEGFTTFDPLDANNPGMQFDYTKITALTLPQSLGDIMYNTIRCCFCDELKTVTFKSTVKELFSAAFWNSPNLTDVYMLGNATEAPVFSKCPFDDKTKVTIHVPQGALSYFSSLISNGYTVVEITE